MVKTLKAAAKRLKITQRKKILHHLSQQSHFKAKESGKVRRLKRKLARVNSHPEFLKFVKRYPW